MITLAKDFNFSLGQNADEYYKPARHYKVWKKQEEPIEPKGAEIVYLGDRGISEQTVRRYQITSRGADTVVFPHFDEHGELQTIKYRNTDPKNGQSKEYFERRCKPILFGMYQCDTQIKTVVVTEGQIDALSVAEAGIPNAISVPGGVNSFTWVPHCWNWLTQFDHIIIFGDHEKGKVTLYADFLSRWKNKVMCVREEDYLDCKDANDILRKYGPEQVRKCIENAQQPPVSQVIDLSEVEDVDVNSIPKLRTGLHQLDDLLVGGLPFGQLILITGKAGDGKSTLANQIVLNAINEYYKVFIYSGELPNYILKAWLTFQAAGPDYVSEIGDGKYKQYVVDPEIKGKISEWYRDKAWIYDNKIAADEEEEQTKLIELVEMVIERHGAEVILLDNLMTAMELEPGQAQDKYDRQSSFMKKLAKIALNHHVLIILVAHKKKANGFYGTNDSVSGSADIVNLASIVMSYERPHIPADASDDEKEQLESMRFLKVTKNRLFGNIDEDGMRLEFDEGSKRIYSSNGERKRKYGWMELIEKQEREDGFTETEPEIELPWEGNDE